MKKGFSKVADNKYFIRLVLQQILKSLWMHQVFLFTVSSLELVRYSVSGLYQTGYPVGYLAAGRRYQAGYFFFIIQNSQISHWDILLQKFMISGPYNDNDFDTKISSLKAGRKSECAQLTVQYTSIAELDANHRVLEEGSLFYNIVWYMYHNPLKNKSNELIY